MIFDRPDVADAGVDLTWISGAAALSDQVPAYLRDHYWWAYVHPNAVRVFERQWLVNAILWGNYPRLRDLALDTLGDSLTGRTLQIACAYGDLTNLLAGGSPPTAVARCRRRAGSADRKPARQAGAQPAGAAHQHGFVRPRLRRGDLRPYAAVTRFLLHEQPEDVRRRTIAEALRVTRPGGKLVIVDYARPMPGTRCLAVPAGASALEPFALDLWRNDLSAWTPPGLGRRGEPAERFFGGLYQMVTLTRWGARVRQALHAPPCPASRATPLHPPAATARARLAASHSTGGLSN